MQGLEILQRFRAGAYALDVKPSAIGTLALSCEAVEHLLEHGAVPRYKDSDMEVC